MNSRIDTIEQALSALADMVANQAGQLAATGMIQNAIATYLHQNQGARDAIDRLLQFQHDHLPADVAGELNKGFQARMAEFRQALALPGSESI